MYYIYISYTNYNLWVCTCIEALLEILCEPIMAYVEVGDSRISKTLLVSQLAGNPTLYKNELTQIMVGILYMKPKIHITANHNIMLKYWL